MKLKLRFLVTFFFLLIGTIIVIKTVSAIETPKPPDIKWNNSSLSGGRKWTTVTFAENMPCGETSKTIEVGDYQDGQLFVSSPSNQSNCHILVEASVDKTVWYAPEGMTAENGRVSIGSELKTGREILPLRLISILIKEKFSLRERISLPAGRFGTPGNKV